LVALASRIRLLMSGACSAGLAVTSPVRPYAATAFQYKLVEFCVSKAGRSLGPALEMTHSRSGRRTASSRARWPPAEVPDAQTGTPG
jgi:hypothetical protein